MSKDRSSIADVDDQVSINLKGLTLRLIDQQTEVYSGRKDDSK